MFLSNMKHAGTSLFFAGRQVFSTEACNSPACGDSHLHWNQLWQSCVAYWYSSSVWQLKNSSRMNIRLRLALGNQQSFVRVLWSRKVNQRFLATSTREHSWGYRVWSCLWTALKLLKAVKSVLWMILLGVMQGNDTDVSLFWNNILKRQLGC